MRFIVNNCFLSVRLYCGYLYVQFEFMLVISLLFFGYGDGRWGGFFVLPSRTSEMRGFLSSKMGGASDFEDGDRRWRVFPRRGTSKARLIIVSRHALPPEVEGRKALGRCSGGKPRQRLSRLQRPRWRVFAAKMEGRRWGVFAAKTIMIVTLTMTILVWVNSFHCFLHH